MNNTLAIHCTTFWKDIHYYKGLLCSLKTFARGWSEFNLVVPDTDHARFLKLHQCFDIGMPWHIYSRPEPPGHGHPMHWLDQMTADAHTNCDFITYMDADCIFTEAVNARECLYFSTPAGPAGPADPADRPKAIVSVEPWPEAHPARRFWRKGSEDALGIVTHGETMCGFPTTYHRCMLPTLRERIQRVTGLSMLQFVMSKPAVFPYGGFAEFVTMGNWALYKHPDFHVAVSPDQHKVARKNTQFWSHRQINETFPQTDFHSSRQNLTAVLKDRDDVSAERCYQFLFTLLYDQIKEIQL